ncbi:beta-lactamase family protein [Massilia sp. IC2-477]|uniref:serine hydrolase domain-containing protein n=1 Tax=Massilia sp. IC2-477 TaxID=2887198 RepID=UPI001D0FF94C|nr:serine hydrolase domain-containing protein [Massilia sp. IC2-477]MCC2954827.1 beta-lactamase family protein [Massilia sp. IC2-477]
MQRPFRPSLCSFVFVLGSIAFPHASAQEPTTGRAERVAAILPEIDKMYTDLAGKEHLPGLVYGVVLDGKLVHARALGLADVERKIPATSSTEFRIASMTKSFVAMAALKLRDEGKLRLDDPVANLLPELRRVQLPTLDSPALTVRQLMTMTTGLPEDNPWGDRQMALPNAKIEQLVGAGLSFSNAPGQTFEYSNLGYILLGKVVSKASGMRFQDYVTRQILRPLGMHNTRWEYTQAAPGKLALGYRWDRDHWEREPILPDGDGAAMGGLITTMDDFARYVAFHLDAWPARNEPERGPVKRASVREMQLPHAFAGLSTRATLSDMKTPNPNVSFYGYGLVWQRDSRSVMSAGHSGGLPGFGSQYRFAPDHGVGVFAFTNLRYGPVYGPTAKALAMLVERADLGPRPVPVSPILATRHTQVAQLVQSWDASLAGAIAAENLFLDRSREDWIAYAREKLEPIGRITSVGPIKAENGLRGSFPLVGERGRVDVKFTLTPEREPKVQEIELTPVKQ